MDDLSELIEAIINENCTMSRLEPAWVAHAAMKKLDPDGSSVAAVYRGCMLHLRQLARGKLARRFSGESPDEVIQHDLFPELQWRYPISHDGRSDPAYVLLEHMTDEDIRYNVGRLRLEGEAKMKHADALEDFGRERRRRPGGKTA